MIHCFPVCCCCWCGQATSELQELFGLGPEENLVESFKCKLLQTYACNHNAFTPAIQVSGEDVGMHAREVSHPGAKVGI